jgi:hypothetical protein
MEAMKMEHTIAAPSDGLVDRRVLYSVGDQVADGAPLLAFKRRRKDSSCASSCTAATARPSRGPDFARKFLPEAEIVGWHEAKSASPCDYAVVWAPPEAMLPATGDGQGDLPDGRRRRRAAQVRRRAAPVPIIRLGDAGMAMQMAEYVAHAVLRYFRRFDEYEEQARAGQWAPLPQYRKEDFTVGVLGLGKLGTAVLEALRRSAFRCAAGAARRKICRASSASPA